MISLSRKTFFIFKLYKSILKQNHEMLRIQISILTSHKSQIVSHIIDKHTTSYILLAQCEFNINEVIQQIKVRKQNFFPKIISISISIIAMHF